MNNLSFQLYSARNTALPEALALVAAAGYHSVEAYGENINQLPVFQSALKASGLGVSSIHISRENLRDQMPQSLEVAHTVGAKHIVCPYLQPADRPVDKQGWVDLAEELAAFSAEVTSNGCEFAWHNHDFEFAALTDGSLPIRLLLDHVPELMWEVDLGWIQRCGESPASWLRTYGDRVSAVHLKDVALSGENSDEDGWADVGHGVVDWAEVVPELRRCDTDLYIVEHDNPSDLKRFAERSMQTIKGWG